MKHSESITKLAAALVSAHPELEHATKNANNPHFKNKYADLTELIDTVKPVLAGHGIAVVQFPGFADGRVTMETVLIHSSGEWISGEAASPIAKHDPQGVGSAITYLRRYCLAAVCNIGQEDDDGNDASKNGNGTKQHNTNGNGSGRETGEAAMEKQLRFIKQLSASHHYGFDDRAKIEAELTGLTKHRAKEMIDRMQKFIQKKDQEEREGVPA